MLETLEKYKITISYLNLIITDTVCYNVKAVNKLKYEIAKKIRPILEKRIRNCAMKVKGVCGNVDFLVVSIKGITLQKTHHYLK